MGTIGKVLPYINGFVMALKEMIRSLALLVGYELPNSSGVDRNILDQMGTGIGDFQTGIEDANSGLDDTKKKLKEINGLLAFDELHTISKTSDSDSSGSGSDAGLGSSYIDPRILAALKDYDNLMDSVNMKAKEIRDTLLEAAEKLGVMIDDHIFQPISRSWDKYGASVIKNAQTSFSNLAYILSDALSIVAKKWDPFFQNLSDLFFSLIDTATLLGSTISKFFKIAWDSGGRILFEGVWDLVTAFLELATAINDDFIKPVIRGLNNTLVPILGKAFGTILGLFGNLLKAIANIISAIAKCKPLVIALASAFTALFITIKVAKFVELYSTLKNILGPFGALKSILLQNSTLFSKLWITINKGNGIIGKVKASYDILNRTLSNTKVWSIVGEGIFNAALSVEKFGAKLLASNSSVATFAGSIMTKLGSALAWLVANPMVAVVAGIAALIAGFALFNQSQEETEVKIEDCSEAVQEQAKRIEELGNSMDQVNQTYQDGLANASADAAALENSIKKLQSLGGKTGLIDTDNLSEANVLVSEVNSKLGESFEITEDGRLIQKKSNEELEEAVKLTKERAEEEAKYQLYVEYQKEYYKALNEQNEAKRKMTETQEKINALEEENKKLAEESAKTGYTDPELGKQISKNAEELKKLNTDMKGLTKNQQDAKKKADEAKASFSNLEDTTVDLSEGITELTDDMGKFYAGFNLSDKKALEFENMSKKIIDNTKKMEKATGDELASLKTNTDATLVQYAKKANEFEVTYDDMLSMLKGRGVELTAEEEKWLKNSYDALKKGTSDIEVEYELSKNRVLSELKKHNQNMTSEEEKLYSNLLLALQRSGVNISSEYSKQYANMIKAAEKYGIDLNGQMGDTYASVLNMFKQYGYDMNNENTSQHAARLTSMIDFGSKEGKVFVQWLKNGAKSDDISPEVQAILDKAQVTINNDKPIITFDLESKNAVKFKVNQVLPKNASMDVAINFISGTISSSVKSVVEMMNSGKKLKKYATGGFPDVGQMFIAREKGPELVGTMGSRSVVANNNQIVSGIEAGVYKAVTQALGTTTSNSGSRTIHTHVYLNSREIADAVHEEDEKGGFDFGMGRK